MTRDAGELKLAAVVLAAGSSKRFGSNKLLFEIRGKSILRRSLDSLSGFRFWRTSIVTGEGNELDPLLGPGIVKIVNHHAFMGIGNSIAAGTSYFQNDADGILLLLGDQPLVGRDTIRILAEEFLKNPDHIIASSVSGILRNPMIFPSAYFEELTCLTRDGGARDIADSHIKNVLKFEVDPIRLTDVDTIEDANRIEKIIGDD